MSENMGKCQFDAIDLPEELGAAVARGVRRGKRRRTVRRSLSGVAAAVMLVFLTANVPPLYAQAADLPLLGQLVRVMRVGTGGEAVTGAVGHVQSGHDRVQLVFTDASGDRVVPVFSSARFEAPRRLVLRLHGLAETEVLPLTEAFRKQEAVADAYALSVTDPAEQGVVLHLSPGWECSTGQYEDTLELQFVRGEPTEEPDCYVLSSEALEPGRELAELTERFLWEGASQLRTASGTYRVVLGSYRTEEQAGLAQQGLLEKSGRELQVLRISHGVPAED